MNMSLSNHLSRVNYMCFALNVDVWVNVLPRNLVRSLQATVDVRFAMMTVLVPFQLYPKDWN
jgi:hypothetical protein